MSVERNTINTLMYTYLKIIVIIIIIIMILVKKYIQVGTYYYMLSYVMWQKRHL